ncbi:MAG TPA: type II toxin-antitoxin system HicB family antitoxin [Bryobacteraceae bacterium]|nr:type II toxin-antitoxin system HicB family antitoxin [Bryobacteraceae bacterium]
MIRYPVVLERDTNGTLVASFPDVPEAHTFGEDEAETLLRAADALETALSMYVDARRDIPQPSPVRRGRKSIVLPALTEAKLALYSSMRAAGVGKAELARRLNWHMPQVDRLLDLAHGSRLDQMEAAFRALGKSLSIEVRDAA